MQKGILNQYAPTKIFEEVPWGELIESGRVIAGGPETVRQRMEDLIKGLRVGNVFCLMQMGDMPKDKVQHSTRLFAEQVIPKLRDVFPEYANDSRFWCHPLAKRVTPAALPVEALVR